MKLNTALLLALPVFSSAITRLSNNEHSIDALTRRDGDEMDMDQHEEGGEGVGSGHHGMALAELDEERIHREHGDDPLSFYAYDHTEGEDGAPLLMTLHWVSMTLSFFIALPAALFLKAAHHTLWIPAQLAFLSTLGFGTIFGIAYSKSTPNLYEGETHSALSWATIAIIFLLNLSDLISFARKWLTGKTCSRTQGYTSVNGNEEETLLTSEPEELAHRPPRMPSWDPEKDHFDYLPKRQEKSALQTAVKFAIIGLDRSVVLLGFAAAISGGIIYTGQCRAAYINNCLAHVIKGSVFIWYGFLTFARYLGAWSELGWSWNKKPLTNSWRDHFPSAEFVECFFIFIYGATQQFGERTGKTAADPVTVKELQHISIAVMMCYMGLLGLLLESKRIKNWLSLASVSRLNHRSLSEVQKPITYGYSFNPIPAVTIFLVGAAMGSHHQTYQFSTDIHKLWGNFLAVFGIARLATYVFLFLRPPSSILPSRPPTELVAAFCLACGGVTFVESSEQVVFAAMRNGLDHMMGILNLTVSFVALIFVEILLLFALKGWAQLRSMSSSQKMFLQPSRQSTFHGSD
ncbi:hypothetical protein BT69DRAFT_1331679 [Atractiella rhizophila]|nr:hypothetical protein BT69DRAFT_1331679 [Atractiella rhizophila]